MQYRDILVVDDDPLRCAYASEVFASAGWNIDQAESSEAAIEKVMGCNFALIFMVIGMADIDGFEAACSIRAHEGARRTPILAVASSRDVDLEARARAVGMDGVLVRPFTRETLIETARPWLLCESAVMDRLAGLFGEAHFAALLTGLRSQLREAIETQDDVGQVARAHRIGGLAGTLGFAALSNALLALADGDDSASATVKSTADAALAEIDRRLEIKEIIRP